MATESNPAFVIAAVLPIVNVPAIIVVEAAPAAIVTSISPSASLTPRTCSPAVIVASFSATTGAASSIKVITFAGLKQSDMFAASAGAQWGFPDGVESVSYERDDMVVGTFGIDFLHIAGSPSSISAGAGTLIGSNLSGFNGRYISCTNTTVTFAWSWSGASNAVQQISRTISDVYS